MKTIPLFVRLSLLNCLLLIFFMPLGNDAQAATLEKNQSNEIFSPEDFLQPNGTLYLADGLRGSLDLQGWNVKLDVENGPVVKPNNNSSFLPTLSPTPGEWFALGSNPAGNDGAFTLGVDVIVIDGMNIYVGGGFTDAAGIPAADHVAKWDGTKWSALGSDGNGNGSLDKFVGALAFNNGILYVGGDFTDVKDGNTILSAADYIAKWDGAHWSALGSNGAGDGALNSYVQNIVVFGNSVYAGGYFQNVNNGGTVLNAADFVARFDGTNWSALGNNGSGDGSLNHGVAAAATNGSELFIGGDFTNVNDNGNILGAADFIAKWDGTHWSALGSNGAGDGSLNRGVADLEINNGIVYAGGVFYYVNNGGIINNKANYIAMFDGTNWLSMGNNGYEGAAFRGPIFDIAVSGNRVYAGGVFNDAGYVNSAPFLNEADYIAVWDGTLWQSLGYNGTGIGAITHEVHAVAASGDTVYVGGYFSNVINNGVVLQNADFIAGYQMPPASPLLPITPNPIVPVLRPIMKSEAISSETLVTTTGMTAGSTLSLSSLDQSGTANNPASYISFQTSESTYSGYLSFVLPQGTDARTISSMLLQVNFKRPATNQIWTWSVYDPASGMWINLGNSVGTTAGQWQSLVLRIPQPWRFVSPTNEIRIQLRSNNNNGDLQIDYEALHITYLSDPIMPIAPPVNTRRPGGF